MPKIVECCFLEPTARAVKLLRRYCLASDSACPLPHGYHDASVSLGVIDYPIENELNGEGDDSIPHDDPRWPTACACGYEFMDTDRWQVNTDRLFARSDNGAVTTLDEAPPGAMWYADWYPWKGPDGRCLVVCCPPAGERNHWIVDAAPKGGSPWQRSGAPPKVTARPSILFHGPQGYHGFLTDGRLEEC